MPSLPFFVRVSMAKRYLMLNPRELERVAARLDRTFPPQAPQTVMLSFWEMLGTPWFVMLRVLVSIMLLAASVWRLVHG